MPPLSALYFPDFLPPSTVAAPLAALFAPLRCYRILPEDDGSLEAEPWGCLRQAGLLELHQPLPGESLDPTRLQGLLRELNSHSGREAALFIQGVVAQIGDRRQEAATELVAPIMGKRDDPAGREEREAVWRALLLLQLAQLQQGRELELEAELLSFEVQRAALYQDLRGEEVTGAPRGEAAALPRPAGRDSAGLLRAWGQLFLRDSREVHLLVSADPEAVALLRDHAADHREPVLLGRLHLPASERPLPEAVRAALANGLQQTGAPGNPAAATTAIAACNEQLAAEHPPPAAGPEVELFLLPETPLSTLFTRICRPLPPELEQRREPACGLLAGLVWD